MKSRVLKSVFAVLASAAIALGAVGCAGKPSKQDVIEGWGKTFKNNFGGKGASDEVIEKAKPYIECLVDETYDKMSADTLNKIAKGEIKDEDKVSGNDEQAVKDAASTCKDKMPSPAGSK